jgi:hypothetical protein
MIRSKPGRRHGWRLPPWGDAACLGKGCGVTMCIRPRDTWSKGVVSTSGRGCCLSGVARGFDLGGEAASALACQIHSQCDASTITCRLYGVVRKTKSQMPSWEQATAVRKLSTNTYSCDLHDDWCIGSGEHSIRPV